MELIHGVFFIGKYVILIVENKLTESSNDNAATTAAAAPKWKRLTPNPANKVGIVNSNSTLKNESNKGGMADLKSTLKKSEVLVPTSGNHWKLCLAKYVRLVYCLLLC